MNDLYMEIAELHTFTNKMIKMGYSHQTIKTLAKLTINRCIAFVDEFQKGNNIELYDDVVKMMREMEELK